MSKFINGKVVKISGLKTIKVEYNYYAPHPRYKKILKHTTVVLVHDPLSKYKPNDEVVICQSRPYSARKHYKVVYKTENITDQND